MSSCEQTERVLVERKGEAPIELVPARQRLIRSAVRVFQTRGYHGAGLTEILTDAGLPKGSLYHAFPGGKEALAVEALLWINQEVLALLNRGIRQRLDGDDAVLQMAIYVEAGLKHPEKMRGSLMAILAQDACPQSIPITLTLQSIWSQWELSLSTSFASRFEEAEAKSRAQLALSLLEGGALAARIKGRPQMVSEIVKAGLGIGPSAQSSYHEAS